MSLIPLFPLSNALFPAGVVHLLIDEEAEVSQGTAIARID